MPCTEAQTPAVVKHHSSLFALCVTSPDLLHFTTAICDFANASVSGKCMQPSCIMLERRTGLLLIFLESWLSLSLERERERELIVTCLNTYVQG